jgi:hypothetical protein
MLRSYHYENEVQYHNGCKFLPALVRPVVVANKRFIHQQLADAIADWLVVAPQLLGRRFLV